MPRKNLTIRGIVLIGVVGLAVAACTPPLPPDVLAAKAEKNITCHKGNLDVGVPEDFAGSMTAVGSALSGVCPDQTVTEVAADAGAKLQLVDHAPTAEEQAAFKKICPTGSVIIVPVFGYAVALSYNVIGLEGMVLTPQATAGMLNGTITDWQDPLITGPNQDYDLSGIAPIAVASLEKPTGAVEAMTAWLTAEDPKAWPSGVSGTLQAGTKFPTTTDLLGELTATEGTIAVLPVFSAVSNGIPVATVPVKDQIISPDDTQLLKVGIAATKITTDAAGNMFASPAIGGVPVDGNFDLASSKIVLASGQPLLGWPIMGMAHMMICDDPADPLPLATAQYAVRLAGQGSLEGFGVTPLPEPIRIKTFTPLKVTVDPNAAEDTPTSDGVTDSAAASDAASPAASDAASPAASDAASAGASPSDTGAASGGG